MKHAIYCGLCCAVVGFLVAAYVCAPSSSTGARPSWMSAVVAWILCPPSVFGVLTMAGPDAGSIWLFFGPLNAIIYGLLGYLFWFFLIGESDEAGGSKRNAHGRMFDI